VRTQDSDNFNRMKTFALRVFILHSSSGERRPAAAYFFVLSGVTPDRSDRSEDLPQPKKQ